MSLVQQLLLRSLVARFWREPYAPGRLRVGEPQLHDRFLLPHFILPGFCRRHRGTKARRASICSLDWFAPHFEFRFPKLGDVACAAARRWNCARRLSPGM